MIHIIDNIDKNFPVFERELAFLLMKKLSNTSVNIIDKIEITERGDYRILYSYYLRDRYGDAEYDTLYHADFWVYGRWGKSHDFGLTEDVEIRKLVEGFARGDMRESRLNQLGL